MPSRDKDNAEEALDLFNSEVPSLSLLGSPHYIDPSIPLTVDPDVQLVCKYLQAYDNKTINRLYNNITQKRVKFSLDSDLSISDCHHLLKKYMSKHILKSKITQQLFIR